MITTYGWPTDTANSTYFVFPDSQFLVNGPGHGLGCSNSSTAGFCGYHDHASPLGVPYAVVAYPPPLSSCLVNGGPNNDPAGEGLAQWAAHEMFEAITDPFYNGWYELVNNTLDEMADKCESFPLVNTKLNSGGVFALQTMYSNASTSCVSSYISPHIQVNPTSVTFTDLWNSGAGIYSILLTNANNSVLPLNWTINSLPSWVAASPTSGSLAATASQPIMLTFPTNITPQTYTTTLTITDPNADNSPVDVPITYNLLAGHFQVSPGSVNLTVPITTNPASQTLTLSNTGSTQLNWTSNSLPSWVSVSPTSGSLASGGSQPLTLTFTINSSTPQTFSTTLTLTDINADNSPFNVPIIVQVGASHIQVTPGSVSLTVPFGQNPGAQTLTLQNTGSLTLNWNTNSLPSWVSVSPSSGSLAAGASQPLTLTFTTASLLAQTLTTTLTITDAHADNSPFSVPISVQIQGSHIQVTPGSITLTVPFGQNAPSQPVTVTNTGNITLNWSLGSLPSWVSPTATSGSIAPGGFQSFTLNFLTAGLAANTYTTMLVFTDARADDSPVNVPITVHVVASHFQVTPGSVSLTTLLGQNPGSQTLTLQNTGVGTMNWTAGSLPSWVSVNPTAGPLAAGASQPLTLTFTTASLAAGTYTTNLTLTEPAADNSPFSVSISVQVVASHFQVTPGSVSLVTPPGVNPTPQTLTLKNTGTAVLNWTAGSLPSWVSVSPTSGSLATGASQTLTLTFNTASLPQQTLTTTLALTDPNADNSPFNLPITVQIVTAHIQMAPSSVSLTVLLGHNPGPQTLTLTNAGTGTLDWTAGSLPAWVSVSPTSGSLGPGVSQPLTLTFNVASVTPQTLTTNLAITAANADNSPFFVPITVQIVASHFQVTPSSVNLTTPFGVNPGPQTLTLNNTGTATLTWTAGALPSWVSISQTSGSLAPGASQPLTLTFTTANLSLNTYSTVLVLTDPNADNSPYNVPISVQVVSSGTIQVSPVAVNLATASGSSPGAQSLTLTNTGPGTLIWSSNALPSWVSVSPTSGSLAPGTSQPLTLTFTLGNSAQQVYSTALVLSDPNATNSPVSVPITVVVTNVSKTWYFAEGYTGPGFTEWLTIANPNSVTANVSVTYYRQGTTSLTRQYQVSANSRYTLLVNNEAGNNQQVSMTVTADQPIVAERPMYFNYTSQAGAVIPGGSDVLGATSLAQQFDFGYLDTTAGHDTWLTILNQNSQPMNVTINYYQAAGGNPITKTHQVPANTRGTVYVNGDVPAGSYSALVSLDQPGLVERPMYLIDGQTGYTGAADVVGVANPQPAWDFAEGYTSSTFEERYILSNPNPTTPATATVTFFLSGGATQTATVNIPAGGQQVVDANSVLGSGGVNNSAHVSANQPILAERFISFTYVGPVGSGQITPIPGASDVLGAPAPSNLFYFAEGYTGGSFGEYLTIENPNAQTAYVTVTYLPANGQAPTVVTYVVAPSSRFTVFTNGVMGNQSFSMVVESNVAIVAERPMYFNYYGITGGSDVVGYQP